MLIDAPRPLSTNNADTIVACGEDAGTLAFAEAMENLDDRLTGSFTLALAVTAPHCSLLPTFVTGDSCFPYDYVSVPMLLGRVVSVR